MNRKNAPLYDRLSRLQSGFSGTIGVAAKGLVNGQPSAPIHWQDQDTFPPASVIKVPILITCLRLVDAGTVSLNDRIRLQAEMKVLGSGVLRDLDDDLQLTVRDLLTLMTIVSDNTATNMVIDLVGGPEAVNKDMASFGIQNTRLSGKLMLPPEQRTADQRAGIVSATTPADMLDVLDLILTDGALSENTKRVAREIMLRQHYTDSLTQHLPWEEAESTAPWEIAAKSGSIQGVRNQVGWITHGERQFSFAILTKGCSDLRYFGGNKGNEIVARVFRILFDHFFDS